MIIIIRPHEDLIEAAAPLLETYPVLDDSFLGVGGLVHSYCTYHPSCTSHSGIKRVLTSFKSFISNSCHETVSQKKIQVSSIF